MASSDEPKIDAAVSKEEVEKAKAEIAEEADDYEDTVDGEAGAASGEFDVTKEEMSIIRAELACEFPDDYNYLRWAPQIVNRCSSWWFLGHPSHRDAN